MEGQDVVTADDHKIGTVVGRHGDCVVVEMGHVFKSRHAIPADFIHEHDGVLRATVAKEIVDDSPKVDGDDFDENAVKMHYGLIEVHVVDPDPQDANAETDGARHRVEPAPSERLATLGGEGDPSVERPSEFGLGDTGTFGGHPRTYVAENDRSTKP